MNNGERTRRGLRMSLRIPDASRKPFRQHCKNGGRDVSQISNALSQQMTMSTPDNCRHWIERVIAHGQVFDISVIAGEKHGRITQIQALKQSANESGQHRQHAPRFSIRSEEHTSELQSPMYL